MSSLQSAMSVYFESTSHTMLSSTKFQNVHIIVSWCTQWIYNLQSRSWLHMSTIRTDGNYLKMFLLVRPEKTMKRRSKKKTQLQLESFLRYIQNSWSFLRELISKSPMKISIYPKKQWRVKLKRWVKSKLRLNLIHFPQMYGQNWIIKFLNCTITWKIPSRKLCKYAK